MNKDSLLLHMIHFYVFFVKKEKSTLHIKTKNESRTTANIHYSFFFLVCKKRKVNFTHKNRK